MTQHPFNVDTANWERLKQGDSEALGYLYDRYIDKLFPMALRLTNNREMAKDALQEVFIEIWNYRETLGVIHHSQSYLVKVLRGIILRKQKKEKKSVPYLAEESFASSEQSMEEIMITSDSDKETKSRLQRALSHLTKRQKLILELRFYEGLSYEQIAEKLCMNYQSVNNLAFRTILRLRSQMYILMVIMVSVFFNR